MSGDGGDGGGLDRYGVRGILLWFVSIFAYFAALFVSAGTIDYYRGWAYFALTVTCQSVVFAVLIKRNPGLLNERGKFLRKDTEPFDRAYMVIWVPLNISCAVVMGLDAVRYGWSVMPWVLIIPGIIMFLAASLLGLLAMIANPYFETTVRIQEERAQKVVTSGPYRFIRHPGYASVIGSAISAPLILGSWWGFAPTGVIVVVLIVRTALEDRILGRNLNGYREYTESTPYRLLPLVW